MTTMTEDKTMTQRVGTDDEGNYMMVRAEIREGRDTGRTIDHAVIETPVLELSITGELYRAHTSPQRGHDAISAGQNRDDLAAITTPAPGWTLEEIAELGAIWDRWHLNTMRAACAHMPSDARARWDRREEVVCEAGTGYKYGSAWLVEELPAEVVERVRYLMRDRSHDLYAARGYDGGGNKYPNES